MLCTDLDDIWVRNVKKGNLFILLCLFVTVYKIRWVSKKQIYLPVRATKWTHRYNQSSFSSGWATNRSCSSSWASDCLTCWFSGHSAPWCNSVLRVRIYIFRAFQGLCDWNWQCRCRDHPSVLFVNWKIWFANITHFTICMIVQPQFSERRLLKPECFPQIEEME